MPATKRYKILFITKWFPTRYDPQSGIFIQKHAAAVARYCNVALLHVFSDAQHAGSRPELVFKTVDDVLTVVAYHKKYNSGIGAIDKALNFFEYIRATRAGLKYIRKNFGDHDITHAYILLRPALIALAMNVFNRKPFLISEQWSGYATGKFKARSNFAKFLTRYVCRKAKAVTVVSAFLEKQMTGNGIAGKYIRIPNTVEAPESDAITPGDDKLRIIVVADLVDEIKNVSSIIRAFAQLAPNWKKAELHIIGDGIDRSALENLSLETGLSGKQIFFHGRKPNHEVYRYLMISGFIVMNSYFETFSLICAEALACGKPVIATRCGGPEEFITTETGMLIEPGDQAGLMHAMDQMLNDYKKYNPEILKKHVELIFSPAAAGKKFYDLYTTMLHG